jgi:hypothetical protein
MAGPGRIHIVVKREVGEGIEGVLRLPPDRRHWLCHLLACMSWGLHDGQWQKRAVDDGADRGRNNQLLMRGAKVNSGW